MRSTRRRTKPDSDPEALVEHARRAIQYVTLKRTYAELRLEDCPLERFLARHVPARIGCYSQVLLCDCQCHVARQLRRMGRLLP